MSTQEHTITSGSEADEQTTTAAATPKGTQPGAVAFPFATAGAAFTAWFNDRLRRLPNATIKVEAKTATVVELHEDGRLQLSMHASAGEPEEAFVPFEAAHLDQLLLKFAAQGV